MKKSKFNRFQTNNFRNFCCKQNIHYIFKIISIQKYYKWNIYHSIFTKNIAKNTTRLIISNIFI